MKWLAHIQKLHQEFIQLFLYSENNMNSQIINLTNEIKGQLDHKRKLEADVKSLKTQMINWSSELMGMRGIARKISSSCVEIVGRLLAYQPPSVKLL